MFGFHPSHRVQLEIAFKEIHVSSRLDHHKIERSEPNEVDYNASLQGLWYLSLKNSASVTNLG
ncbi:hypothetical protein AVEN_14194-1, partial [Araneus ventricosus]